MFYIPNLIHSFPDRNMNRKKRKIQKISESYNFRREDGGPIDG